MKSNKEMIEDVFSRIEEEKMKERKKRQHRVYVVSMSGIGLAILIGIGALIGDGIKNGELGPLQSSETQNGGTENASVDYELLARIEQAVWAREKHYHEQDEEQDVELARTEYANGLDCDRELYDYLTKAPEKIYAIVAVPKNGDKESTKMIRAQMDAQGIVNFVYMNRTNGQFNCYILVTAEEFLQIRLENAQDYWFNHALKPTNIEQILFPEMYGK